MKAKVDADLCAGCGTCVEACEEVFELQAALVINRLGEDNDIPEEYEETCRDAATACPVEAIVIEE